MVPTNEDRFPSNSYTKSSLQQGAKPQKPKVEKVVSGRVGQKKKSLGQKFTETFLAADIRSTAEHICFDVLIPAAKETLSNMLNGAVDMMLFGERRPSRGRAGSNGSRVFVSYNDYYDRSDRRKGESAQQRRPRANDIFEPLCFAVREDAEEVLDSLVDMIQEYQEAAVSDLYSLAGLPSDHTKERYGWYNLAEAKIEPTREGFLLRLPKPVVLD